MPDRLEMKWNGPPVSPINWGGATLEISDQPMLAMPLPKKASAMNAITSSGASTKLAPMMELYSSRPQMIGDLRAQPRLAPLRRRRTEIRPDEKTTRNAARNGVEAERTVVTKLRWRK